MKVFSLLLAVLPLALWACGPGEPRVSTHRFIQTSPEERFRHEKLIENQALVSWPFQTSEDLEGWELNAPPEGWELVEGEGLHLEPERGFVTFTREVRLDSTEVDSFILYARRLSRQPVSLEWCGPGQTFSESRKVEAALPPKADGVNAYRLAPRGHPEWRGTIARVRFGLTVAPHWTALVERIEAFSDRVKHEALERMIAKPWRINSVDAVRAAHLVSPEHPLVREVEVPELGELTFSYALEGDVHQSYDFRITLSPQGGTPELLFSDELPGSEAGWRSGVADLSPWAGRRVRLELAAHPEQAFDARVGIPVWANVEVLGRSPGPPPPNLVLISIDTLRSDHLSLYGYERQTSPAIDEWARSRAVVFENAIASSPWTLPSHISIFTGQNPQRHGVNYGLPAPSSTIFLAEILREAGYSTSAVTGGGFIHPNYGFVQGFDNYGYFANNRGSGEEIESGIERALALLERHSERPFFLFFHTYEVHNPFRPRQPHLGELSGRDTAAVADVEILPLSAADGFRTHRRLIQAGDKLPDLSEAEIQELAVDLYDSQIAYTDTIVARLFAKLEELGIDGRTIVVLTSDHGELFGEHGEVSHYSVYEENLAIPLVIAAPGKGWEGRRIAEQVSSVDIMPTVLDLLSLPVSPGIDGASLVPAIEGHERGGHLAWSYAANSSYGLSIRYRNRLKYVFANGAWRSEVPAETLETLGGGTEKPHDEARLRLRRLAEDALIEQTVGLRLLISNLSGQGPLSAEIRGGMVKAHRVKALRVGHGVLQSVDPSVARAEVEPGAKLFLSIESTEASPLRIHLTQSGGNTFKTRIDTQTLEKTFFATRGERGWDHGEMALPPSYDEPPGDGIYVWWHRRGAEGQAAEIDEDLRRQLEALGYVE